MPRYVLLITAVLCLTTTVAAQAQTAPLPTDLNAACYDRSDTLRAVQHLFMQRSNATRAWLETGVSLTASAAVEKTVLAASGVKKADKDYYQSRQQDANQDLVAGSLMAGYGAFRLSRFGPWQYQRVMGAYAQGSPLPQYLTRRLKPKYFRLLPL